MLALVVDDDAVTRRLVSRAVQRLDCEEVLEAGNGREAQALLEQRDDVDLVLTDILMPEMDGLELLRWGREHAPDTAWIILSGLDTFDSAVEAIRLGAFDFLAKPPRTAELEVAVRNALERRALVVERERLHAELRGANEQLVEKVRELEEKSGLLQRDLERAEVIQRALLPPAPPALERFCVHSMYRPGQHLGGDLYDVVRIDDRCVALYVADATGHGITAAMLSVLFKQRLVVRDEQTGEPLRPAAVLAAANRAIGEAVAAPGLFLTAVYCLVDTVDGEVTLASAGHPPVLHLRADGSVRQIERTGPALGLVEDVHFDETTFRLEPEDRLFLYTDGLVQPGATQPTDGLPEFLTSRPAGGEELLEKLLETATSAVPSEDRDDVTLLLLEVSAGPSSFDNGRAGDAPADSAEAPGPRVAPRAPRGVVFYGETEAASYLALRGRATWIDSSGVFETARAIREADRPLVLDLAECEYLDSTFLGTVHELVEGGDVRLQNVRPEVRELFDELGMDRVLASVRENGGTLPELYPLATAPPDTAAGRARMLDAHETLAALNERNRESFSAVLEGLRKPPPTGEP